MSKIRMALAVGRGRREREEVGRDMPRSGRGGRKKVLSVAVVPDKTGRSRCRLVVMTLHGMRYVECPGGAVVVLVKCAARKDQNGERSLARGLQG